MRSQAAPRPDPIFVLVGNVTNVAALVKRRSEGDLVEETSQKAKAGLGNSCRDRVVLSLRIHELSHRILLLPGSCIPLDRGFVPAAHILSQRLKSPFWRESWPVFVCAGHFFVREKSGGFALSDTV